MPYVVSGLVGAGALAAALSTADGLLLTIANSLSHDLYYKMINPKAATMRRLLVARVLLLVVAVIAAYVASLRLGNILAFVSYAFSIAAAAFFPALVLGIFWKRATSAGAVAGMLVGFLICIFYLLTRGFHVGGDWPLWFGTSPLSCGIFGIPLGFLTIIVVSLVTPAPDQETQDLVESVRYPRIA